MCKSCDTIRTTSFSSCATSTFMTYRSALPALIRGVAYLLWCLFVLQYVGQNTWALIVSIGKHLANIHKRFKGHSLSKHYYLYHNRNPSSLQLIGIEKYSPPWRKSNLWITILRRKTCSKFDLRTFSPWGLNVDWKMNCYINNSWAPSTFYLLFFYFFYIYNFSISDFFLRFINKM